MAPCHIPQTPMGGRAAPHRRAERREEGGGTGRADCLLIGGRRARPRRLLPLFPGMTFSLGNHFLRASTAIFNFNSFMKSCPARVNTADRRVRAPPEPRGDRPVRLVSGVQPRTEPSGAAADRPPRVNKHRERTCPILPRITLSSCMSPSLTIALFIFSLRSRAFGATMRTCVL